MLTARHSIVERLLIVCTGVLASIIAVFNVLTWKDSWLFVFYLAIVLLLYLLVGVGNWVCNKIPYIPREIGAVWASAFFLAIAGLPLSLVLAFLIFIFAVAWIVHCRKMPQEKRRSYKQKLCLTTAYTAILLCLAFAVFYFNYPGKLIPQDSLLPSQSIHHPSFDGLEVHTANTVANSRPINAVVNNPDEIAENVFYYGSGNDKQRDYYGVNTNFKSSSVDASALIENWQGFSGWYRTKFWGFDSHKLPLNGKLWLPKSTKPVPLVLIVHGDHAMADYSEFGYDYLAQNWLKQGYAVVTIDENFLNRSWSDLLMATPLHSEMDARAYLILEHLQQLKRWGNETGHALERKIDFDTVALVGHSRGGEAIAHAAYFNSLPHHPDINTIKFDYGFGISALVAIAPVDGLYWPAGKLLELDNIDYLVVHGSHDNEVPMSHLGQYGRVHFSKDSEYLKAALYIFGANHGQFNSTWGNTDQEFGSIFSARYNLSQLLPAHDQEALAISYFTRFINFSFSRSDKKKRFYKSQFFESNFDSKIHFQYSSLNSGDSDNFELDSERKNIKNSVGITLASYNIPNAARFLHVKNIGCNEICYVDIPLKTMDISSSIKTLTFDLISHNDSSLILDFSLWENNKHLVAFDSPIKVSGRFKSQVFKMDAFISKYKSDISFNTYQLKVSESLNFSDKDKLFLRISFVNPFPGQGYFIDNLNVF